MQLSAPIYVLKRKAKLLAREVDIPLHQALDQVAIKEGFQSWSHLVSSSAIERPAQDVLSQLEPGDLLLIAARPGQGKTLLGLELAATASRLGRKGYFFTLDYHERDVSDRLSTIGIDQDSIDETMVIDTSDDVSADHIIDRLKTEKAPVLIVIDYVQLLDQKRSNPSLDDQLKSLRRHVIDSGAICALISQIDRSFDLSGKPMPEISDLRLPNPINVSVFSKLLFLHEGNIQIDRAA
ncbi:MAG: DNA helicase [Pseudomonadota bacterium]